MAGSCVPMAPSRTSPLSAQRIVGSPVPALAFCQSLLSRVPTHLISLNKGLTTLQFQGISVDPHNASIVQGGTQDNGTWQTNYSAGIWPQIIYGDGGQSGFSATNSNLRFNSFTGNFSDVNFQNGSPTKWVIATGPIVASGEGAQFYAPVIADPNPAAAGTIFQGSNSVWRTQDWAGSQVFLEANCPEFFTSGANPVCGDFVQIGPSGRDKPDLLGCRLPRNIPFRRQCGGHPTDYERHRNHLGGDHRRSRLHLEECGRICQLRNLHPFGHPAIGYRESRPVRERDRHRPQKPEPCLDLVFQLQFAHSYNPRPHLLRHL